MTRQLSGRVRLAVVLIAFFASTTPCSAQPQEASPLGQDFFKNKIGLVLASRCSICHSSTFGSRMGGFSIDTREELLEGGNRGQGVVPGKPDESGLLQALRYTDPRLKMPPGRKLPDSVIADFEKWIAAGAPDPWESTDSTSAPASPTGIGSRLTAAGAGAAQLPARKALHLEIAKQMAAAAEQHASKNHWNVVIVIVDGGGHPLYIERMDGAPIGSVEVALQKARSAVYFRRPTKAFEDGLAGGRTALVKLAGAMPFEGGVPIEWEGQLIGAIGVSGVTAEQGGRIAQAGVDALKKILGP